MKAYFKFPELKLPFIKGTVSANTQEPLARNEALYSFSLLLNTFFLIYIYLFAYLGVVPLSLAQLLMISCPFFLGLTVTYTSAQNKFLLARFITTYIIPLSIF